jgi:hypothetical protein
MKKHPFMKDHTLMVSKNKIAIELNETSQMTDDAKKSGLLDKTFTLRQARKYFLILVAATFALYVWQLIQVSIHEAWGGAPIKYSPYLKEIPEDCQKFADRHQPFAGNHLEDALMLRSRSIHISSKHLTTEYGGIRCLGYAVLTGLTQKALIDSHPLNANFVDTYVDENGKPIVRITVNYFQPYQYEAKASSVKGKL